MSRKSALISEYSQERLKAETRFYLIFGILLAVCGFMLLALPVLKHGAVTAFLASWMLFAAAIYSFIRPAQFSRGIPDWGSALISAILYGLAGYITGGANIQKNSVMYALCIILIFAGISRLIVFAGMYPYISMPAQVICFAIDMVLAVMVLFADNADSFFYWYAGLAILTDGAEALSETLVLRQFKNKKEAAAEAETQI